MKLHKKQKNFVDDLVNSVKNNPKNKKPVFITANSAPGSGKTTILLESSIEISNYLLEQPEIDKNSKQILILVFDKKMKDAIEKRIVKHPDIHEEFFEITTVHSLFFREIKKFQSTQNLNNSFELDYTKGFFTKKMIKYFLDSLSFEAPSLSNKIPLNIDDNRFFNDMSISNEININIMWALVNTYYSSPHSFKAFTSIVKDAKFFFKKDVNIQEIELSDDSLKILEKVNANYKDTISIYELLFRMVIKRINQLATIKEQIVHYNTKTITIPMEMTNVAGEVTGKGYKTIEKEDNQIEVFGNLIKVPHCFYYKSFYNKIVKDKNLTSSVFGKYKAFLIDESQDNDRILFQIVLNIAKHGIVRNFAFVGDPLQSIYGFKSPDHFDMLSYMDKNKERFKAINIDYHSHPLDITFRFNKEIANFVNSLFGSNIEAISQNKSFVYPEEVTNDKLSNLVKNLSAFKNKTVAIICRSNAEAMRLFVELKTQGSDNVVLHSSSKDELKNFVKKGSDAIDNERAKNILLSILNRIYKTEKQHFQYSDILSSEEAIVHLANNGFSALVRFSKDEIDKYIVPANKKRKDIVWIGTAHLFKGAEFDYTIVAGDFFKKHEKINVDKIVSSFEPTVDNEKINSKLLGEFFNIEEPAKEIQETQENTQNQSSLMEQLNNIENYEEKCIYYVAYTRAKEGVFICESPYWEELKKNINNSFDVKKELGYLLEESIEISVKEENKKDKYPDLFVAALSV